jgi:hypothetical protein
MSYDGASRGSRCQARQVAWNTFGDWWGPEQRELEPHRDLAGPARGTAQCCQLTSLKLGDSRLRRIGDSDLSSKVRPSVIVQQQPKTGQCFRCAQCLQGTYCQDAHRRIVLVHQVQ